MGFWLCLCAAQRQERTWPCWRLDLSSSLPDSVFQEPWLCCLNASFLHFTLAVPDSVFPLAVAPAHSHCEEQTSWLGGHRGVARRARLCPRWTACPLWVIWLLRSGAKEEVDVAAGIYREYEHDSLSQGLPGVKRVTDEIKYKHGGLL